MESKTLPDSSAPQVKSSTVAVVAVHGVGDPGAGSTSRAIARLLLGNVSANGTTQYSPFHEHGVRISVSRVNIPHLESNNASESSPPPIEEHSATLTQDPDIRFTLDQIASYEATGTDAVYESTMLSSSRLAVAEEKQIPIDLFELYWADLARLSKGLYGMFAELYQIMLHLSEVGRQTVAVAVSTNPESTAWKWFAKLHTCAVRSFTLLVPVFSLHLLAASLLLIPGFFRGGFWWAAWSGAFAASIVLFPLLIFRGLRRRKASPAADKAGGRLAPTLIIGFCLIMTFFIILLLHHNLGFLDTILRIPAKFGRHRVVAFEWFLIVTAALFLTVRQYERRRPGAMKFSIIVGMPLGVLYLLEVCLNVSRPRGLTFAALRLVELLWFALTVAWVIVWLLSVAALIAGAILSRSARGHERYKTIRTVWTARLTLALPVAVYFLVTMIGWSALYRLGALLIHENHRAIFTPLVDSESPLIGHLNFPGGIEWLTGGKEEDELGPLQVLPPEVEFRRFMKSAYYELAWPSIPYVTWLLFMSAVLLTWGLLPSVVAEARPGRVEEAGTAYGQWMSDGMRLFRVGGFLVLLASLVFVPAMFFGRVFLVFSPLPSAGFWAAILNPVYTDRFLLVTGMLVVIVFGLILIRGRAEIVTRVLGPPLQAMLDVDAYLRVFPKDLNPKARIFARFVSLLRYIGNSKHPDGSCKYTGLIIIAHSQGTVITADLLRLLRIFPDDVVATLPPLHFLTVGSPLRQLYAQHFPDLYWWVEAEDGPALASITGWVNMYRSGDYIGRYLWRSETDPNVWEYGLKLKVDQVREEECVGGGAHTHYWDNYAPKVAQALDAMISRSAES